MTDTPFVPAHVQRLKPYVPGKPVEELERELGVQNAVKLASNESPFGPSPRAVEAAVAEAANANRYPDASTYLLRQDLAAHMGVSMDEIMVGNGSNEIIDLLCRVYAGPETHAVFPHPSFVCYSLCTTGANVPATAVPLVDGISYNVDAMLDAVKPETSILFVANPNNPTGAYIPRPELEKLLRGLPHHVLPVIDEAYVEFPDADDFVSAMELRDLHPHVMVLRTFSKAYGLAAFRVGYAIAPAERIDFLNRMRAPFNVNSMAQAAARAALGDPDHVKRYVELNRVQRARVTDELRALGLTVAPSQANFVLVDYGRPGPAVYDALLREGVIVRPMPPPIDTWQRVTVGLPEENDRLVEVTRKLLES